MNPADFDALERRIFDGFATVIYVTSGPTTGRYDWTTRSTQYPYSETRLSLSDYPTVLGDSYTSGGPPPKDEPKAVAHARAVAVLGPKRGRWK